MIFNVKGKCRSTSLEKYLFLEPILEGNGTVEY